MLATGTDLLARDGTAVAAITTYTLESTRAIVLAAERTGLPVLLSAGVAALLFRGALAELLRETLAKNGEIRFGATAAASWAFALLVAGGVLGAAAWAVRRRSAVGVVAVQLVALLQFAPALPTDEVANLTGLPSFGELVRDPATLLCVPQLLPDWERRTPHRLRTPHPALRTRLRFSSSAPTDRCRAAPDPRVRV